MSAYVIPVWKTAPFFRHLIPFVAGILTGWHSGLPAAVYWSMIVTCTIILVTVPYTSTVALFRHYWITGAAINMLMLNLGGIVVHYNDIRHHAGYFNDAIPGAAAVVASIADPLTDKPGFYRTTASITHVYQHHQLKKARGKVILYFQKDRAPLTIDRYATIVMYKLPEAIVSKGNPGTFDLQRYYAWQNIFHQVYLKTGDYRILSAASRHPLQVVVSGIKEKLIRSIKTYVPGKREAGMAAALLIGYKDDLDKTLVQFYTQTGVVHVIAISGLHLGLIYWLLALVFQPLAKQRAAPWLQPLLIITGLWLFSFVSGGSPSVLRSALMFSFIAAGKCMRRNTSVYNSLAASAFVLLCFNPYWLWDAGFQLSYLAVLSIVIFMKPVYNRLFFENKLLDALWKSCAISLAAQVLTTPVSICLFHQFPNYFLVANLIAVPLSGLVVFAEIALCAFAWLPAVAMVIGHIVHWLIWLMNRCIEHLARLPFSSTTALKLPVSQTILVYLIIGAVSIWLLKKEKRALPPAFCLLGCLALLKCMVMVAASQQQKLVVYNIPRHQAIDIIQGRQYVFMGDSMLNNSLLLQNAYLNASRTAFHLRPSPAIQSMPLPSAFRFAGMRIMLVSHPLLTAEGAAVQPADVIIVTGNPNLSIGALLQTVNGSMLVIDSSNPAWKVKQWKADCKRFGIACYPVAEKGAFILPPN